MGKKDKNKGVNKIAKMSSGKRRSARIMRTIQRLQMKINRWDRYKEEIKKDERKGSLDRWDTSGLQKHMKLLEGLI